MSHIAPEPRDDRANGPSWSARSGWWFGRITAVCASAALLALLVVSCGEHTTPEGGEAGQELGESGLPGTEGRGPLPVPERRDSTTEVVEGFGAETIEVPHADCSPVRSDPAAEAEHYPVPLPPFSKGVFPCTRCHDRPDDFNLTKRNLTAEHTNIKLVHGPREQWCYGCHNPTGRDQLRLAGGRLIRFEESYELCGQCHGTKLRDWRKGIHGRRTGCWNGSKEYRLCVHCHNPHAPKFKPLEPKPAPTPPAEMH